MKDLAVLSVSIVLLIAGMVGLAALPYLSSLVVSPDIGKAHSSLGERIYFSGRGEDGRLIPYGRGPHWLRMHGGSCSSCHGDDGTGGFELMMSDEEAPSITWEALTEEAHDEHEKEDEHPPFSKRTIKRALTKGLDPADKQLASMMPRWEMNQKELDAVIDFLKKLD